MKLKIWELSLLVAVIVTILCGFILEGQQRELSDKLIRIHVVANSDSDEDQALKLAVRDAILEETGALLKGISNIEAAREIIGENLTQLNACAAREIEDEGFSYTVSAGLQEESFPTREYETFSLPAGRYMALRVVIGEGDGKNWWCVMFPPLCLTDGVLALSDESKETLKNNLTTEEYNLVTKSPSGAVPIEVRFKIVEIFQKIF